MMKTVFRMIGIGLMLSIPLGVQAQEISYVGSDHENAIRKCTESGGTINRSKSYDYGDNIVYVCELPDGSEKHYAWVDCSWVRCNQDIPETRVEEIVPEEPEQEVIPPEIVIVPEPEDDPTPTPTPTTVACTSVPSFAHFTVESDCSDEELSFTFTPKGSGNIALHVNLKRDGGRDILSAWCTGNEKGCKAIGNGKACSGSDYTGANAWCYKAN